MSEPPASGFQNQAPVYTAWAGGFVSRVLFNIHIFANGSRTKDPRRGEPRERHNVADKVVGPLGHVCGFLIVRDLEIEHGEIPGAKRANRRCKELGLRRRASTF